MLSERRNAKTDRLMALLSVLDYDKGLINSAILDYDVLMTFLSVLF